MGSQRNWTYPDLVNRLVHWRRRAQKARSLADAMSNRAAKDLSLFLLSRTMKSPIGRSGERLGSTCTPTTAHRWLTVVSSLSA